MSSTNVLLPTLKESTELHELQHNLDETTEYIKQLSDDKEQLQTIESTTKETLIQQFEDIRQALDERQQVMLAQLEKKYKDRDNLLYDELAALNTHKDKNEETCDQCKDTIASVDNKDKSDRASREKTIRDFCQDCIDESPFIHKVPISLHHTFDRKKHILDEIATFSLLKFKRFDSGIHLPFTRLNAKIVNNKINIGAKISPKDVPLMEISSVMFKAERGSKRLVADIKCRDTKISIDDDKEQEQNMIEQYKKVKQENTFVYVQVQQNNDRSWKNFDSVQPEEITYNKCVLLSSLQHRQDKYTLYIDHEFEVGTYVHMRAKLVHLEDDTVVNDDGTIDDEDIIRSSKWSSPKKVQYGKAERSPPKSTPREDQYEDAQNGPGSPNNGIGGGDGEFAGELGEMKEEPDVPVSTDEVGSGSGVAAGSQLKKIKIKVVGMTIAGKDVKKTWTFHNNDKKQEFTFDNLVDKTRKLLKMKKVENFEHTTLSFAVGENEVATQQDFINYCVNAPDPQAVEMTINYED